MEYGGKRTLALAQEIIEVSGDTEMEYLKVIKLLYLCDRQMYKLNNSSITGDDYISTATGPMLAITQGLIQEEIICPGQNAFFHKHFRITDGKMRIENKISEADLLNSKEKMIATEYTEMFGDLSVEQLSEMTHRVCSEWTDPTESKRGSYATKISEEDIKKAIAS